MQATPHAVSLTGVLMENRGRLKLSDLTNLMFILSKIRCLEGKTSSGGQSRRVLVNLGWNPFHVLTLLFPCYGRHLLFYSPCRRCFCLLIVQRLRFILFFSPSISGLPYSRQPSETANKSPNYNMAAWSVMCLRRIIAMGVTRAQTEKQSRHNEVTWPESNSTDCRVCTSPSSCRILLRKRLLYA